MKETNYILFYFIHCSQTVQIMVIANENSVQIVDILLNFVTLSTSVHDALLYLNVAKEVAIENSVTTARIKRLIEVMVHTEQNTLFFLSITNLFVYVQKRQIKRSAHTWKFKRNVQNVGVIFPAKTITIKSPHQFYVERVSFMSINLNNDF